jgi:hypothetical protein
MRQKELLRGEIIEMVKRGELTAKSAAKRRQGGQARRLCGF